MRSEQAFIGAWFGLGLLVAAPASAADPGRPAKIDVTHGINIPSLRSATLLDTPTGQFPIYELDATNPVNPEGVSLIRFGNHKIPRPSANHVVRFKRAEGDAEGSVFVWYAQPNGLGGHDPRIRKIAADNQLAFDTRILFDAQAGIAADGAGGVYVASHKAVAMNGDFLMKHTTHTTYRLSPTGEVTWQVTEAAVPNLGGNVQRETRAARSDRGVFVGYAIATDGDDSVSTPVLLHRKADSGSKIYTRTGLKGPAAGALLGNQPLHGRPGQIFVAADNTAITAIIDDGTRLVALAHVNAAGTQTAAYTCNAYRAELLQRSDGDVLCVTANPSSTIAAARYGVRSGVLKQVSTWNASVGGWNFTQFAVTPGGQLLAAADVDGAPWLALFSSTGAVLKKASLASGGHRVLSLAASSGAWQALLFGDDQKWSLYKGTYSSGGSTMLRPTKRTLKPVGKLPSLP